MLSFIRPALVTVVFFTLVLGLAFGPAAASSPHVDPHRNPRGCKELDAACAVLIPGEFRGILGRH